MKSEEEFIDKVKKKVRENQFYEALSIAKEGLSLYPLSSKLSIELSNIDNHLKKYESIIEQARSGIDNNKNDADSENTLGRVYYDLKQYDLSIIHYQNAIIHDSTFAYPEYGLGKVYHDLKDYELATIHYQNAIGKDDNDALSEHCLGNIYFDLGKYELSIKHYQNARVKDSNFSYAEYGLGTAYFSLKNYDLAIEHCKNAINKKKDFPEPEYVLGEIYCHLLLYDLAIKHYQNAINKDEYYASPEKSLGNIYFKLKKYELAIDHYQKAIALDDTFASVEYDIGLVYDNLKEYDLAIKHYQNAIDKDKNFAKPEYGLGVVYYDLKEYDLAIIHHQNAITKDGNYAAPENGLGKTYFDLKKYDLAIKHYQNAIDKDNNIPNPEHGLGNIYSDLKEYDLAIKHYQNAIDKEEEAPFSEHGLGNVYFDLKKYDLAIKHYQNAIDKEEKTPFPEHGLGNVYSDLKEYDLAIKHYQNAIDKDGTIPYPEYGLGMVYCNLKQYDLAIKHYQNAINKDSKFANPENGLGGIYYTFQQYDLAIKHYQNAINKDSKFANPENGLGNIYLIQNNIFLAKVHYLRFISLDGLMECPNELSHQISFFSNQSQSPFVVEELLKKYTYRGDDLLDIVERTRKTTEDLHLYLAYLKYRPDIDAMQYNYLLALTHFFMDLPFETYRICEDKIDMGDNDITLMGNFFWLSAASAFSVPNKSYDVILENAIDEAESVHILEQPATPADFYYAGHIFWTKFLIENDPLRAQQADDCFAVAEAERYLPAAYMRVLTLKALNHLEESVAQTKLVEIWETNIPEGPMYLSGYTVQELDPNRVDFLSPFLHYAHFYEIREAIETVNDRSNIPLPEFHEAWNINYKQKEKIRPVVEKGQFKDLKEGILRSYKESVSKVFTEERAQKLYEDELEGIHEDVSISIERLFKKAEEYKNSSTDDSSKLEKDIAKFIHSGKIKERILYKGKVTLGRYKHQQLIAYFVFKGDLEPLQALSLIYYAFFTEISRKPRSFSRLFVKDSNIEGVTDTGKDLLEETAKALINIGVDLAVPNIFPLKFIVGFTVKYLISNFLLFIPDNEIQVASYDDYRNFKDLLESNTFEMIKEYHPKNDLEQQALDIVQGWYNYRPS